MQQSFSPDEQRRPILVMADDQVQSQVYNDEFQNILGTKPEVRLCIESLDYPWAHEAGVFIRDTMDLYITSNRITSEDGSSKVIISKVNIASEPFTREEIHPDISMANGGMNYRDGVLFCSQGTPRHPGGIVYMEAKAPYRTRPVIESFLWRQFNSPNDVVVHRDGSIWFTDPIYGFEQGFRPSPQLPNLVYRYDPASKSIRVMADGFGRPNGISFSPDQNILYITDTDYAHGDGSTDLTRASSVYAFDVVTYSDQPFLTNRRPFAMADVYIPDGIKCDEEGNVYSGCGDGINVWSAGGVLLGKILIPGGVANFCFCRAGEIMALNETRLWQIRLSQSCRGTLVKA